jgi:ribose 5-phosphate isomerase B
MKVAIGNDHAGVELKNYLIDYLKKKNIEVVNVGTDTTDSCDYPVYAKKVAGEVIDKNVDFGILICGTGIGISIAANKVKGIRAAKVNNTTEAKLAREHNHANIICLGARIIGNVIASEIVDSFIEAKESSAENHLRRLSMLD